MAVELCIEQLGKQPVPKLRTFLEHGWRAERRTKVRNPVFASNGDLGGRRREEWEGGGSESRRKEWKRSRGVRKEVE